MLLKNQKLEEFKKNAGIDYNPDQEGLDLFAELIVAECADWIKSRTMSNELKSGLKKHFGVKE